MEVPEPEAAARNAIRHWSRLPDLAAFAEQRHGYGDSNGGFGVTYPGDLDEYDRLTLGDRIPDGFIRACGFRGPPEGYEVLVPEGAYLAVLAGELTVAGHIAKAARVQSLTEAKQAEPSAAPDPPRPAG